MRKKSTTNNNGITASVKNLYDDVINFIINSITVTHEMTIIV